MKRNSKLFAVVLALFLIVASVPTAFAAGTEPGKTASVSFTLNGIYGVDGTFSYSNKSILSDVSYSNSGEMAGKVNNDVAYFYSSNESNFTITVTAKVASSAKNGDSCQITFKYRTSDANGNMTEWKTMTKTITVEVHTCSDGNNDHKCDSCGTKLTSCKDGNSNHKCDVCGAKLTSCTDANADLKCDICGGKVAAPIDYTELDRQLDIANGLNEADYTSESWSAFEKVLQTAKDARNNGDQATVDKSAADLEKAISELVKMDYSKLIAALESAKNIGDEKIAGLIDRLIAAIEAGNAALKSNDQAAVDAAASELEAVISELEAALGIQSTTSGDSDNVSDDTSNAEPSCNVTWHNVLLILLIISVALNLALGAILIVPVIKKKMKKQQ